MRDAPVVALEQCTLRIYAGEVLGVVGPVEPKVDGTQLYVVDGSGAVDLPLDPEGTALVLVVQGTCTVAGVSYGADRAFYAPPGGALLTCALAAPSRLVVALGAPTADPVVIGGPFVMNSEEEVAQAGAVSPSVQAYEDFLHGRYNATGGRSETVEGDSDSSAVEWGCVLLLLTYLLRCAGSA